MPKGGIKMKISGRNKLVSTVKKVVKGKVMAEVVLDFKGVELVSVVTMDAVKDLGLKPGDKVTALIKATEVMLIK
jgi:molybdopterin-binding protein